MFSAFDWACFGTWNDTKDAFPCSLLPVFFLPFLTNFESTKMAPYQLLDYRLAYSATDFCLEVHDRQITGEPVMRISLETAAVVLAVDVSSDLFTIGELSIPLRPDTTKEIELTENADLGLDSISLGGVGISDLRDQLREVLWFDLKRCRISFELLPGDAVFRTLQIVAEAHIEGSPEAEYFVRTERRNPQMPN